ncbi:hypothetical protein PHMEG_00037695 [Phytophthora megakarya]|uniref:Uncharacterized protein n=1 Tax=Phytophthora megakarya TaxID=4795 RepID=A0A225UIK0_9STRA|nr:hypothetical protein PHMEG_00037695 [Phytophthora megakarya]
MVQGTLVSGSSSSAPTSGTVPTPAVLTSETAVVLDQGVDPTPGNLSSADTTTGDSAISGATTPLAPSSANTSSGGLSPANFLTPAEVEGMSLAGVISGVPTLADTGLAVVPVSWDMPPAYNGPDVHLAGSLDATDFQDLDKLMGGDIADCLPFLRPRVAPASLAAEVDSIAEDDQFLLIRRLLAKIRHLQAASEAERSGTLSSETLVARENFDTIQLTDQVAQLQAQLRDSEAARQAAERRAEERVLDVNALVDFLMGNKPKINVMFNWMRLPPSLR